ncbi:hypothetical protein BDR04DRAFT_1095153 [Suillus decipiens]|nr:hypothetical protein BDR04DRAFT_1095153 [Suillus decipiens]
MRFSILAVVVALTASMYVSACMQSGDECVNPSDCCSMNCESYKNSGYWYCV